LASAAEQQQKGNVMSYTQAALISLFLIALAIPLLGMRIAGRHFG
jgi:hypothetical protein